MSTELTVETPAVPSNSDDAVAARFREAMGGEGGNQNSIHSKQPEPAKADPAPVEENKVESSIPDEFLSDPKQEEDEYETLLKEEPKGPVKHENFKKFRTVADKKIQALVKELEEVKGKVPKDDYVPEKVSKQLEELSKKLQEKEDLISRRYVEETPEFKEKFTLKKESILNRLNKAAKDFELPERMVKSLIATDSLKERTAILEDAGLSSTAASSLTAILDHYDSVEHERNDFLSDWKTRSAELEEASMRKQDAEKAKIKQLEDRAFDEVRKGMEEKFSVLKRIEGNKAWNERIDADIAEAKAIFDGDFTPHQVAELAIGGRAAIRMGEMLETVISKYKEVVRERDELKAASPSFEHGGKESKVDPTKNMTADERAAWTFNQLRSTASNGR